MGAALQQSIDELVGLDLVAAMPPARRAHFYSQIGSGIARPIVPGGLAPFMHLPDTEPRTLTRARMAAEIARAMSANGCVTEQDLAGFDPADVRDLFHEAKRIARVDRMVA